MMDLSAFPFDVQNCHVILRMPARKDAGREFEQYCSSTKRTAAGEKIPLQEAKVRGGQKIKKATLKFFRVVESHCAETS